MGTIAEEITRIQTAKSNIKTAIENKGVVVGDITIDGYADKINQIVGEGGGETVYVQKFIVPEGFRCQNSTMTSIDVGSWDVSNMTSLTNIFYNCETLTTINGIGNWAISNVNSMNSLFYGCDLLTTINGIEDWNVSNVTNMNYLFCGCSSLTTIDLSNWKFIVKPYLTGMFSGCTSLVSLNLDNWVENGLWSTAQIFSGCKNLTTLSIKNWDLRKVSSVGNEFYGCTSLTTLDMTGCLLYEVSKMSFSSCTNLENLSFGADATQNWSFDSNEKLTVDSLMSIFNGLYDFVGNGKTPNSSTQGKLTLGSVNLAKLSDEQKAIATNKGWTLS